MRLARNISETVVSRIVCRISKLRNNLLNNYVKDGRCAYFGIQIFPDLSLHPFFLVSRLPKICLKTGVLLHLVHTNICFLNLRFSGISFIVFARILPRLLYILLLILSSQLCAQHQEANQDTKTYSPDKFF